MDGSAIACDEFIESYDNDAEAKPNYATNFNGKRATCKTQNFCILLAFLLIVIA